MHIIHTTHIAAKKYSRSKQSLGENNTHNFKKALVANCVLEHRKGTETLDLRAKAQRNVSRR